MVTVERVGLQCLIVILIRINVNAAPFNTFASENVLGILSKLLSKRSRPLIIVVDKSASSNALLRTSDNQNQLDAGIEMSPFDDTIDADKAKRYVKAILRSTGDENDPLVNKTNIKFKNALRDRCSEYAKCESTCEPKKKKKKKDCEKSCKEVFDYLMLCHPPGGKTKKTTSKPKTTKKDSCESSSLDCGEQKDSCASADTCAESKDSCASADTCAESKDSCASADTCAESKDSCATSEECVTTTEKPKPKFGTGKTMPPSWRY